MASKKIGALWVRKMKDGNEYFSGVLDLLGEDIQIAVFFNDKKESGRKQPDFNIVRSGQREESESNDNGGRKSYARSDNDETDNSEKPENDEIDIEDIPF